MKYKLKHQTVYEYLNSVDNYQSIICLNPINSTKQSCNNFNLEIHPTPHKIYSRIDIWGNIQHYFSIHESHKSLKVIATSDIEVFPTENLRVSQITCEETLYKFKNDLTLKNELLPFLLPSPFIYWDNEVIAFAAPFFESTNSYYESIKNLMAFIFNNFKFNAEFSTVNTPLKEILKERKGVCQDFSHLAIACLRSLGFAARYVSGYLETLPPPGKPKLQGSDASHAWVSVYIPEMGWVEFDPTNNLIPGEQHIITAYGRDYADVVPIKGIIFSSGSHKVDVEVDVIPVLF
jgi:transglutaminase-like putative cysteine protease